MNDVIEIKNSIEKQKEWILKLFKSKESPEPITNETDLKAATEIVFSLKEIKKGIETVYDGYYRPLKTKIDEVNAAKKSYLDIYESMFKFVDNQIWAYNQKIEAERLEVLRKQREAEAEAERQRMQALIQEAEKSKNEELKTALVESEKNIIAKEVSPELLKTKVDSGFGSVTQSYKVTEVKIVDSGELAKFLISQNFLNMIFFDKKTNTAIKEYLNANPKIKEFPGTEFVREAVTDYRKKGGQI